MINLADRHEPLSGAPWSDTAARAGIAALVADALAHFDASTLWPSHPRDVEPGEPALPLASMYHGAAGAIWSLRHLERAGLATVDIDFGPCTDGLLAHQRRYSAAAEMPAPSYPLGDSGVLLLQWAHARSAAVADELFALVTANLRNPTQEFLWGSPGTMLAALHVLEATGEARWLALFREAAAVLYEQMHLAPGLDDTWVWTQDLYGEKRVLLGAGHGFAGNVFPFVRGAKWLDDSLVDAVESRALKTLGAAAVRENGAANWEPMFDHVAAGKPSKLLMHDCHGAPGIVCRLAGCRSPALRALVLEGAEAVWRAGPLNKGQGLCHGTAGNGYALLKAYAMTSDAVWLDRARAFAMHALGQCDTQAALHGQRWYTLWTGDFGVALLLAGCLTGNAAYPTLDVF